MDYEKFIKLVKEKYDKMLEREDEEEREEYFNSEEAQEAIKESYDIAKKKLKEGEITERIFENGVVDSLVYCLYMMY